MRIFLIVVLTLVYQVSFGQQFEIIGANSDGKLIPVKGEVFVDLNNKSIALNINGRDMEITKMTFKKGDVGELLCFKESIEVKQRFKFSPNKKRRGDLLRISHIMNYTVVHGFSNKRSDSEYYLIKKRN